MKAWGGAAPRSDTARAARVHALCSGGYFEDVPFCADVRRDRAAGNTGDGAADGGAELVVGVDFESIIPGR